MSEQGFGSLGHDGADLGGIEVGAGDQQELDDAVTDGGVAQELAQHGDAGRLVERLGDGEEFIGAGGAVQLTDEFGDDRRADLGVERKGGEHPAFGRQGLRLRRGEEGGDGGGLALEVHADQEALEFAVVGFADLDRLAIATRGERLGQGRLTESEERRQDARGGDGFAQGLDRGLTHLGVGVGAEAG